MRHTVFERVLPQVHKRRLASRLINNQHAKRFMKYWLAASGTCEVGYHQTRIHSSEISGLGPLSSLSRRCHSVRSLSLHTYMVLLRVFGVDALDDVTQRPVELR